MPCKPAAVGWPRDVTQGVQPVSIAGQGWDARCLETCMCPIPADRPPLVFFGRGLAVVCRVGDPMHARVARQADGWPGMHAGHRALLI